MDFEGSRTLEMAALGRPFTLGMLYDCRQDTLVPGITLWDCSDLEKNTRSRPKPSRFFEIVASESLEDKSSALKVEASLKASFFSGLVEVEGSAKYLNDSKTSKNQARVTLNYMATTKFQELSMNHLGAGNVKHQNVFDKGLATHVVTGILYGAQAFFVFDREVSEKEDHQDIQGNVRAVISKIPCMSIEGEGSLKMEDKDRGHVEKLSCKFHGDFSLQKNPVSFKDAVEVFQSLPELLGSDGENAVPMKVWLLPLASLDSAAAKLVRQISIRLVQESQSVLEDFSELEIRCNDALKTPTVRHFPEIGKKIKNFKAMCSEFRQEFQQKLARKLPAIRGGGEEESVLAEILKKRHSSPFNTTNLNEWLDYKKREICVLKSFTNMMQNTQIVSCSALHEEIFDAEYAVCFAFTTLGNPEPYLTSLSDYLKQENTQDACNLDIEKQQWYLENKVADELRHKAKLFSDFAAANQENPKIKFLAVGYANETQKGSSIYLYKNGFRINENFEPPSEPETVTITDINHDSVTVAIRPPKFGAANITSYAVEYGNSGKWKQEVATEVEEVTVSGLSPNTEYFFRCRAVTVAGIGPANQIARFVKTLPCSPPGKPKVEPNSSEISVIWEKPSELGRDVQILSYIVEYAKNGAQWSQMMAMAEKVIISGLHTDTDYAVKIRCDCGVAGRSKESDTVNVSTTKLPLTKEDIDIKDMDQKTFSCAAADLNTVMSGYFFGSPKRLAEAVKAQSTFIKRAVGPLPTYRIKLNEEQVNIKGCRYFSIGKEPKEHVATRTILVIGATGVGKSTLINGMINYLLGVQWQDPFRFKLIDEGQAKSQAHSQTSEVTVYKVHHQDGFMVDFSLTIIDTPGFGDTRGITRDKEITEQLKNLFFSPQGVSEVDAVCFVAQSALRRLTPSQRYVFDSLLSIFGKDVAENIRILVTFADGQQPPVLEAINASEVPCPKKKGVPCHFKFNNSALFAANTSSVADESGDENEGGFDSMFWTMGAISMKRFFAALNVIQTKSLTMTKEVLKERKQLETFIENLQLQVKVGLAKLKEIKQMTAKLQDHEAEISRNEKFEIEVPTPEVIKEDISGTGTFSKNCQQCHFTCHRSCTCGDTKQCWAMDSNGYCTECPKKCYWNVHFNQRYRFEYRTVMKKQALQGLKDKYMNAMKAKVSVQEMVDRMEDEYQNVQDNVVELMERSEKCLNRLKEIALKPNPLSTPDYIDMLIEGEKSEAMEGWSERVKALISMRERAVFMAKVEKGEKLLRR